MKLKPRILLNFDSLIDYVSEIFNMIPDDRIDARIDYSIHDALMSGFACMYFQDPSLNQFQKRLQDQNNQNNLKTLFKVKAIPSSNRMTEIIDEVNSPQLAIIFSAFLFSLVEHHYLEKFKFLSGSYLLSIDGKQYFTSKKVNCKNCLINKHTNGPMNYSHGMLLPAIVNPGIKQVIPFMPEEIRNQDGFSKQDCEINSAKRMLSKIKKIHPSFKFTLMGDSLFSKQPFIKEVLSKNYNYLLVAKPTDHRYMFDYIEKCKKIEIFEFTDEKNIRHKYEWVNNTPLTGSCGAINTNFLMYTKHAKTDNEEIIYKNSWVTNIEVSKDNIEHLVKAGKSRWKSENECFNTLTNQGYYIEHNYGHGSTNACFNYCLLSILAFFFHQIFELTDKFYLACRDKFGSKKSLWETLRSYIRIIIFDAWDLLLQFALQPDIFKLYVQPQAP